MYFAHRWSELNRAPRGLTFRIRWMYARGHVERGRPDIVDAVDVRGGARVVRTAQRERGCWTGYDARLVSLH